MIKNLVWVSCLALLGQPAVQAETLSLPQVVQKVIDHYPSIKSAALQVEKARQENLKVESQLSWVLAGSAGFQRNTSLFGTATDQLNASGSLNRNLQNGGVLGFNADINREDSEDTFGPTIPNPTTKTRVDVNYRHRLEKGAGNPSYEEDLLLAKANETIADSERFNLYDNLADQIIGLYIDAATTQARIKSIDKTIARSQRLKQYIDDEYKLGLSEEKDVLQVDARLSINEADKKSLQVAWQKQQISLNRLMGRAWDGKIKPVIKVDRTQTKNYTELYQQARSHSPDLKRIAAQIRVAESTVRSRRDQRKDELDLVMFIGNEFNHGDTSTGSSNESELIGGISIEFNRGLDKSGLDAEVRQAHYDRGVALEDKKQVLEDLQYSISSLLAEINTSELALEAFRKSVDAEQKKLQEATVRYRDGRIETDRIIEFESQLANAELSLDLQSIELLRRYHQLNLVRGGLWKNIVLPEFTFDEYTKEETQ